MHEEADRATAKATILATEYILENQSKLLKQIILRERNSRSENLIKFSKENTVPEVEMLAKSKRD